MKYPIQKESFFELICKNVERPLEPFEKKFFGYAVDFANMAYRDGFKAGKEAAADE